MSSEGKRLRLFIALDLPAEVRRGIARWGDHELSDPALRRVDPEALHVTLAFLGSRPESEVEALARLVGGLRHPAPRLALTGVTASGAGALICLRWTPRLPRPPGCRPSSSGPGRRRG